MASPVTAPCYSWPNSLNKHFSLLSTSCVPPSSEYQITTQRSLHSARLKLFTTNISRWKFQDISLIFDSSYLF
ncbi:hypothetical protein E2C01_060428 [Portunus trituberculatus]|uniref:Uncharacterized protein n=1 Tax=Portunus trituberculatus TaxID=210409 RepID=A0A5B7H145_PORTR|nr:hypothetical protein [Portunus trituberculatus]